MSDTRLPTNNWPITNRMKEWWKSWRAAHSRVSELACCEEYELERMARDLGMPLSELRELASHGPEAADFLLRRMTALKLDRQEVAATLPATFQDLQRLCTLFKSHRQCGRDLGSNADDPAWEVYCPNVAMLKLLDSLPWATRSEW
jgi:hypothetical protein